MKKLLIAFSVVAVACVANAAQWIWGNTTAVNAYDEPGDTGALASGQMYLVYGITQTAFTEQILAAGSDYESTFQTLVGQYGYNNAQLASGETFSNPAKGSIVGGSVSFTDSEASGAYSFYQVMIDTANDGFYISEQVDVTAAGAGEKEIMFANDGSYNKAAYLGETTFVSDGWYNVPEPTSGMLLLLGMMGLALKRKRA